jgi:hypothetical protein
MLALIQLSLLLLYSGAHAQLVGPGAMAPYGGGGGGSRRHGGYVRVQEPAKGFFVAGSALRNMNGLYGKVERVPVDISHKFQLAYKHDQTGWIMALTSGSDSEWLIIDDDSRDRFKHEGKTIIPGSGQRWSHLHRAAPNSDGTDSDGNTMPPPPRDQEEMDGALMSGGDDIAELPWQMIAVLDEGMLNKLRRYSAHHHGTVQRALAGNNLPNVGGRSTEMNPPGNVYVAGLAEANDVCLNDGDIKTAMSLYGAAIDKVLGTSTVSTWSRAIVLVQRAQCWRRISRDYTNALSDVEAALDLYPAYTQGLFEKGIILFDSGGKAQNALHSFLQLLKLERGYPKLDTWLVRSVAQDRRTHDHAAKLLVSRRLSEARNAECVAWRQTTNCNPNGEREESSDKACSEHVPSGVSGYCECTVPSVGVSAPKELKSREIFTNLLEQVKYAAKASCDRHQFNCNEECRLQWKQVMSEAEKHEQRLREEGQTTLEDVYRTGRMHLENWKYEEYRRHRERSAAKAREDTTAAASSGTAATTAATTAARRQTVNHEAWRVHDLYGILQIAHDFTPSELKRAYRRESVANHPDKGGSDEAFQRVAAAKAVMTEPSKLEDYNRGKDLDNPDADKQTLWEEVERKYFPERYGFEPFGDPLEDHAEGKVAHERRTERIQHAREVRAGLHQENIAAGAAGAAGASAAGAAGGAAREQNNEL